MREVAGAVLADEIILEILITNSENYNALFNTFYTELVSIYYF